MRYIKYILNLPDSLLGLLNLPFCIPLRLEIRHDALCFHTRSCGAVHIYAPDAKGYALGNVVVVRHDQPSNILEHELVHVEQHMRYPFIFRFLYWYETLRHGYWNNRFEVEAYDRTNSWPND